MPDPTDPPAPAPPPQDPIMRCTSPDNFKEGEVIIAGKPWDQTETTLYDTGSGSGKKDEAPPTPADAAAVEETKEGSK
ncbi:hypothetical protein B0T26DRAFT_693823 [Lasiosphaeria miniovina]|uniref:Uncharacterized protein n=1 Tax=Lasiosphaeria miniovina TaxID=1954250 RepID=A0AA40E422_9PEZI|nr:uncharacterized protein B0T26DRAFT_693823 [Lasiosphaeria miniovina]KAK0727279.1 hypothetical protein B0T26DRAFT_693823 [Lasiosphaeria miniovina]